ncbi:MAG: MotA/TolQ/ExbB proton channel family protein [Deferribacterota bacterium]|nr:MotA/TolQ/ExbB proton channel family protein [Deferribacterota bacterium]
MIELFKAGGVIMYPIVFLSVLALAMFLERIIFLRPKRYVPKDFTDKLLKLLNEKSFDEAKILCDNNKSAISVIAKEILNNVDLPISRLLEVAEETGRTEGRRIEKYLPTLQIIANLAPLLGFFGTVVGMVKTFIAISQHGMSNVQPLAGGISEALLTTAAGLPVAIISIIFYYIIKFRSEQVIHLMEKQTSYIINAIFKGE